MVSFVTAAALAFLGGLLVLHVHLQGPEKTAEELTDFNLIANICDDVTGVFRAAESFKGASGLIYQWKVATTGG